MSFIRDTKNIIRQFVPPIAITCTKSVLERNRKPYLEYAPNGWQTELPEKTNHGWSVESVIEAEKEKWEMFCSNVRGAGPLGFSHEAQT